MKFSLMSYTMWPMMNSGKMSIKKMLKHAKKIGFEAIEFSVAEFDRANISDIKKMMDKAGLKTSCINGHYNLADSNGYKFKEALEGAKKMIDNAVLLQSKNVMIVPAIASGINGFEDKNRAAGRIAEGLRELVAYADELNIKVSIEDFPKLLYPLGTIKEIQFMLDSVPGLKLTFDNGNFLPSGDDLMEAYEKFKCHIENVHIKDWELSPDNSGIPCSDGRYIRGGLHGKGLMDHTKLLKRLKNNGYSKYLAFEYEGVLNHLEAAKQGMDYLKGLMRTL